MQDRLIILQVILINNELNPTFSARNISEQKFYPLQTITLSFIPHKVCTLPLIDRAPRPVS
jgi:hypothetical protein